MTIENGYFIYSENDTTHDLTVTVSSNSDRILDIQIIVYGGDYLSSVVLDPGGNDEVALELQSGNDGVAFYGSTYYIINATPGAGQTLRVITSSSCDVLISVLDLSNMDTTAIENGYAVGTGTTNAPTVSFSTTEDGGHVHSAFISQANSGAGVGTWSGVTGQTTLDATDQGLDQTGSAYATQTSAGTITMNYSTTQTDNWLCIGTAWAVSSGPAVVTGTATLSGTGTLTAAGDRVPIVSTGSATLTGTGTLTASGDRVIVIYTGSVTMSGIGALNATAIAINTGSATLAGTGTLAGIGIALSFGTATLTGTGTLTAAGEAISAVITGSVTMAGTGTLASAGVQLTTEVVIGENNNGYISALPGEYGRAISSMADTQDVMLTYSLQFSDTGGSFLHRTFLRASGDWAAATLPTTGVEFEIDNVNGTVDIYNITTGSRSASQANGTYTNDTVLKQVKIEVAGTTARIKIWNDGSAEPGTWAATWSSAPQNSGTLQLGLWSTTDWHKITIDDVLATYPAVTGSVTMAGTGALTASAIGISSSTATLAGQGTLTATAIAVSNGTVTLSGTGTIIAAGSVIGILLGTATLSGTGTLTGTGIALSSGTVTLTGTGTLTAAGDIATAIETGSATLSGTGVLTGIGIAISNGTITMSGAGTLTASGIGIANGTATLTGTGTLTAYGTVPAGIETGSATLVGTGALTGIGIAISFGTATLTGAGTLTTSSLAITTGASTLTGVGTLTATGQGAYPFPFFDDFTGVTGDPLDSTKWTQAVT
jgi:hypothetical protein